MDEPNTSSAAERARDFFDNLWNRGDPWALESSDYERAKYARQLELVRPCKPEVVLEIGCGAGAFSRMLAQVSGRVVALDVSPAAIERARAMNISNGNIEYHVCDALEWDYGEEPRWDMIVLSETIYYLGWLYSYFQIAWLLRCLHQSTRPGGRLLMTNTISGVDDYLMLPWLIASYHDLALHAGYEKETEERFAGEKDSVRLEALISLYRKPAITVGSGSLT